MTRALMLLLYADSSARFYQSVEWAGRTSSPSRSRPQPLAQGVRTVLKGDEEGGSDDGILGRSRREAGVSAKEAAEVGYPFEAPPGMDTAGLQDPVCHTGDFRGLPHRGRAPQIGPRGRSGPGRRVRNLPWKGRRGAPAWPARV